MVVVGTIGAVMQTDSTATAIVASFAAVGLAAVFALIAYLRDSFR